MRQKLPSSIEADELHSIGLSGLVEAARKYQPSREASFAGYAATRIRGAIQDELRRQDSMSRSNRAKAKRLGSAICKLEQEQGGNFSQDSLCLEMNMSEDELADLIEDVRPVKFVSLDDIDNESDSIDQSLHDIIPDDHCISALDALERKEIISLLAKRIGTCRRRCWPEESIGSHLSYRRCSYPSRSPRSGRDRPRAGAAPRRRLPGPGHRVPRPSGADVSSQRPAHWSRSDGRAGRWSHRPQSAGRHSSRS